MNTRTGAPSTLLRRSREALSALAVQFLLGVGAGIIGGPEDNTDGAQVVAGIVLGLHILVGVGVVVVAVRVWMAARSADLGKDAALWALVVLVATFLDGVVMTFNENGWLSFLMAAGFLAGAVLYVQTYVLATRAATASAPSTGTA